MMPGSTSSSDPSKAKVTSATNGIFVRPVAVAGIFCPPSEVNSKPALPEKRRFSTLVGDLRPCSSGDEPNADDFSRRRQSWDTRQKEVLFGQALLRKTPKNTTTVASRTVKPDGQLEHQNGSDVTNVLASGSENSSESSVIKSGEIKNRDSASKSNTLQFCTEKNSSAKIEHRTSDLENKQNCSVTSRGGNELKSNKTDVAVEKSLVTTSSKTDSKISKVAEFETDQKSIFSNTIDAKNVSTIENTKQSKKVYGLLKRESKSEIPTVTNDCANDIAAENLNQKKTSTNTKVYGVSKTITKKDPDADKAENELLLVKKTLKSSYPQSENDLETTTESTTSVESVKLRNDNRISKSPPKDFRTVRRTSDVIAARIQNIFSNFQSEKPVLSLPKKTKHQSITSGIVTADNGNVASVNSVQSEKTNLSKSSNAFESEKVRLQEVKISSAEEKRNPAPAPSLPTATKKDTSIHNSSDFVNIKNQGVRAEAILKKDAKADPSINASSKQQDKKITNIKGTMPMKKDHSSSDGTKSFVIATNQETDHKSPESTATSNSGMQDLNKNAGAKKFIGVGDSQPVDISKGKNFKSTSSLNIVENSFGNNLPNSKEVSLNKTISVTQSSLTSQSEIKSSTQLTSSTSYKSTFSSELSKVQKKSETTKNFVNGGSETSEITKLEVTKITPSTVPGTVPTVNVLFRTKSPISSQSSSCRDENRKKVVIETSENDAPKSSAIIISPSQVDTSPLSKSTQSAENALKTVERVQLTLNSSPKVAKKHTIVNLQKEELATVALFPNNSVPCTNAETGTNVLVADQSRSGIISSTVTDGLDVLPVRSNHVETAIPSKMEDKQADIIPTINSAATPIEYDRKLASPGISSSVQDMTVVSLDDWTKKFQQPEIPRAPLRRRAMRDSLPPSLPSRSPSRFGSLRRIDDSPRYLPRSPSHSSLPQRYSYTEMLSKVCSMGVLPYVEPVISKSCSSSSSQVSELWSELSEEQSTATHASEMLEAETTERMRLEKEVHELQNRYSQVQQRSDKMEMEIMESRVYRTPELNGDLSEDDDPEGNASIYKQKYERAVRNMDMKNRRIQQQLEEEIEQKAVLKKASDKRLAEALEDVDEERQIANQWKRKAQKCGAELQDLRLMLEEQMARNGELEKKQRRFDAELSTGQEEIKKEKLLREKFMREKEQAVTEKYSLEQDLQATKLDSDMLHEKIAQLNRELDELTLSSKGEEEVTQLKRSKQDLERKTRDQEEELEELAAQVQMLEQAKLRLEMSLEKIRQEHRREASVREEEIEEIRASFSKKIKNLEAQLESEQDERHQLVKQKHELERRIYELADQPPPQDPEIERRLRRDLKRTKALLRDAQSMLEHTREGQSNKTLIRQLKNQLEDSEFAKATAIKARQAVETELQDCQLQLEEITRTKNEAETRCLQLSREKSGIQTQLEEAEEEMAEVMKKYKSVVAQMSVDQKALAEQNQQILELETERNMLKEQLSEVSHKFEHLSGQSDDVHKVHWLDSKIRDLESKLELEQTTRTRLENQIARLKEQNDRAREECDSLRNKELQAQEAVRRLQRQIRDLREDYSSLQQKEADGYRKQHELEMALENTETDLQVTKNDLRLACQRIQDLQNALEDDLDSGTDVPDDSGSDSDSSFELSMLRNQSLTPIQRCESMASNLSYDTEGHRSRTASFTQELSAFSSRDDAEKDFDGLPGLNSTMRLPDSERDETA